MAQELAAIPAFNEDGFFRKLRRFLGKIPFVVDLVAVYFCMRDPATSRAAKLIAVASLAYFILPPDLIPDFLPGGFVDDGGVLFAAIRSLGRELVAKHYQMAREYLEVR